MSDAAATNGIANAPGDGASVGLSQEEIDRILADFRIWLLDLTNRDRPPANVPEQPRVDLFTLIGQFTALRHEVNLQTKAARAAVEQNAEVLKQLAAASTEPEVEPEPEPDDSLRPVVKAIIDITDALALSLRQMEKLRDSVEHESEAVAEPPAPADRSPDEERRPGFFARLFGTRPAAPPVVSPAQPPADDAAANRLRQLAAAVSDGYAMSLRRVERLLPTLGVEPMPCVGEPFDPELMEVVEVVEGDDYPAGTVAEEVRPGYLWQGKVFRFAQVKVAR